MRTATDYDTIVAGAGPAGIMAALKASERGSTLLVDASMLPRDKSCGGMLNSHAQEFLERFGTIPDAIRQDPAFVNFRFWDWDRDIRKPTGLRFMNVERAGFDKWLLDLLPDNVDMKHSTRITEFAEGENSVSVTLRNGGEPYQATCRNLVGADGARSAVRRGLGVGSVATYVTLQEFVKLEGDIEPFFDCIYMRDIGDSYAYSYVVPKGGTAIIGSVFYPHTRHPAKKHEQVIEILRRRMPELGAPVKREGCVALSVRSASDVVVGSGRVLLAGEAGGFMSPTSGEGISYAMNSGLLAGSAIAGEEPRDAIAAYSRSSRHIARNISRKLRWLPLMESRAGKYVAGFVPTSLVSQVTQGL